MAEFINTIEALGDDAVVDSIIERTITEFKDNIVESISGYSFTGCSKLVTLDLPNLTTLVGAAAFCENLSSLKNVNCPKLFEVTNWSFYGCDFEKLTLPGLDYSGTWCFGGNAKLRIADFRVLRVINGTTFERCPSLIALVLRRETIVTRRGNDYLANTPIGNGDGYIYVPRSLLSDDDETKDYRRATNWTIFADKFRALEDYTVDGTTTGELDETKI